MNGDLRLGFASDDCAGTKFNNLTGTAWWSDGTEMVTLDYSHLTSVLWGVCKGFQARLDKLEEQEKMDFNVRDPRKLYRLARSDMDVTQARPASPPRRRGRPDRLQPEHQGEDQVRPRLHHEGGRGVAAEKSAEAVGQATKRATRELVGEERNFVVTTDLGNELASLDRELPEEAVRRPQRHGRDRPGHPDPEEGPGHASGPQDFEQAAGAYNARPHEDVERQAATEFRLLQDNADKFQHNKDLTDRRRP